MNYRYQIVLLLQLEKPLKYHEDHEVRRRYIEYYDSFWPNYCEFLNKFDAVMTNHEEFDPDNPKTGMREVRFVFDSVNDYSRQGLKDVLGEMIKVKSFTKKV